MKLVFLFFNVFLCFTSSSSHARSELPPLKVVDYVNIDRYLGKWFQIASIPQSFQEGCTNSQAEYSKIKPGLIKVINSCEVDGRTRAVQGKARVVDISTNAKLKVQFMGSPEGDYWIIELDDRYQYAVVGVPSRKALWILSRTRQISDDLYNDLLKRIELKHLYDTAMISRSAEAF